LEIPLCPPSRFFNRDYIVFDCGGMAFSEANLKPFVRVCSSLPDRALLLPQYANRVVFRRPPGRDIRRYQRYCQEENGCQTHR
jgi:hypothetical protein